MSIKKKINEFLISFYDGDGDYCFDEDRYDVEDFEEACEYYLHYNKNTPPGCDYVKLDMVVEDIGLVLIGDYVPEKLKNKSQDSDELRADNFLITLSNKKDEQTFDVIANRFDNFKDAYKYYCDCKSKMIKKYTYVKFLAVINDNEIILINDYKTDNLKEVHR